MLTNSLDLDPATLDNSLGVVKLSQYVLRQQCGYLLPYIPWLISGPIYISATIFRPYQKPKKLDLRVWWIYWRPIWVVLLMKHIQVGIAFRLYAKLWWFIIDEWHLQRYDLDNISNQIISSFEWIKDGETSAYYELFYLFSWGQEIEETCRKIGKFIRKFLISSIWVCNN